MQAREIETYLADLGQQLQQMDQQLESALIACQSLANQQTVWDFVPL